MSSFQFIIFIIYLLNPTSSQLDESAFLRIGLRWLSPKSHSNQFSEVVREVQNVVENSVHREKILKNSGRFLAASLKRAFGEDDGLQAVDKHHKRTNLLEVAKNLNLTTFVAKSKEAGINDVLDHEGKFTVFAPTNEAFERMPSFCNNVKVKVLMKFHVSKGVVPSSSFKNNLILRTLLTRRGTRINVYQNKTVVTANGRRLNQTDFKASNGVLHVLDDVMCAVYRGSAVYAVSHCPNLTNLTMALNVSGLYSSLDRTKRITLLAPSDDAFSKLPPATLDYLMNNVTALKEVLLYHVIPDVWYTAGLEDGLSLPTLQGQNVTFGVSGNVTVNNATIIVPDATVKNGVVHGIDSVLLPTPYEGNPDPNSVPVVLVI